MAIDMNQLIAEFINSPETGLLKSSHPNLTITFAPKDSILPINGSPVHLKKVLMNVVYNAAESMVNGGSVTIAARNKTLAERFLLSGRIPAGNYVEVTVTDNGVGIARNDIERIFEPFYTTKSMGRSGTGLGMAVVWSSVQDHQGYIDITSRVGAGTTITLYFPTTADKPRTIERRNATLEDLQGEGEIILVVDDVPEQLEIASNILRKLGYYVETAASGEDAVTYLKTSAVDLVVLDMVMPPGIDGLETFKQITAINPEQRAIIASGFAETERVQEALQSGIDSFVRKPYSLRNFGYAVKSALR
jgi:CheY-like chemotaxis protein/anti-sigma regulatory factor (Ser/Thr protein kinase)